MSDSTQEIYTEMNVALQLGNFLKVFDILRTACPGAVSSGSAEVGTLIHSLTAQAFLSLDSKSQQEVQEEISDP